MDEKHYLSALFQPRAVAIVGATERAGALGAVLMRNMLDAGYTGQLIAVNPKHRQVQGVPCFKRIGDVKAPIDLAVIATPAHSVPAIVQACGKAGVRFAIVLSAGFGESGEQGQALQDKALKHARKYGLRLLGPNSLGLIRPSVGLNASFVSGQALPGSIGFISQSGALCAAILDYARPNQVGFSNVVSMGVACDLDFGEILDYMVWDARTEAILLYIEALRDARRFLSALRAAARAKPVLVLKAGRHPLGLRAAHKHTGSVSGEDAVFAAALRRSGVVRLDNLSQLYAATKALFAHFKPSGSRLAILCNGAGPGVIAADRAGDLSIPLAQLSATTKASLRKILPLHGSHANPIDLIGDAEPARYIAALSSLLKDEGVDGVLCILAPQAMSQPSEVAEGVVQLAKHSSKPILTCWLGDEQCLPAREIFRLAGIPSVRTPETAVDLFSHISAYYRNQKLLAQAPAPLEDAEKAQPDLAIACIQSVLNARRTRLHDAELRSLLAAFHIPLAVGSAPPAAEQAPAFMLHVWRDAVFGPVIGFGQYSHDTSDWADRNVVLPPLNGYLAHDLLRTTGSVVRLQIRQQLPDQALTALAGLLLRVSHLICELPWLQKLALGPIRLSGQGLDIAAASMEVVAIPAKGRHYDHMCIHPYPTPLIQHLRLANGTAVTLRPIKPEDAQIEANFVRGLSPETKYFRFMSAVRELSPSLLAKFTQIDYLREMALIATLDEAPEETQIGVCRYSTNPDGQSCEFAIVVADAYQGSGLGRQMMLALIAAARGAGLKRMNGVFLASNPRMLQFVESLGFVIEVDADDRSLRNGVLDLTKP